jgi:D-3-phosphoglycerate dehydrogenase
MDKYQILTLNPIAPHGLHRLPAVRYVVGKAVEHPDAILVRSHDMHSMPIPASVKAIGRAGAGTNNIPVAAMSKRGVPVFNAHNANAVMELVLAAILIAARNVIPALHYVAGLDAAAPDLERQVEDGKKQFAGVELPHRTLGIVGLGAIGSLVADTTIKLGMKVVGFDPEITVDAAWRLPSAWQAANIVEELLKQSDFSHLTCSGRRTRGLQRREALAAMKAIRCFLFARRSLDEPALIAAALAKAQGLSH